MTAYDDGRVSVHLGDCLDVLRSLPDASVDAVVTDPPYGLVFMGKHWDDHVDNARFGEWCRVWAVECLRVLKPGGHMLAFGGTRTWHRLACAVEDAGFEVRDSIAWLYGSGFPKSLDVSKAIDKAAGAEREVLAFRKQRANSADSGVPMNASAGEMEPITAPATPDAERWQGWGTALKPAFEPVVVARKPLSGTVAANVLAHGTGALNVDGCRINPGESVTGGGGWAAHKVEASEGWDRPYVNGVGKTDPHTAGRWPANVVLDGPMAAALDEQSGELHAPGSNGAASPRAEASGWGMGQLEQKPSFNDTGGASRFFYVAKAPKRERPTYEREGEGEGRIIEGASGKVRECRQCGNRTIRSGETEPACGHGDFAFVPTKARTDRVAHPTVKPLDLMRWLVRLVTPPGGVVLEPFAGSGTTVEACIVEGFRCIAIEREADYLPLILQRIHRRRDPVAAIRQTGDDLGLFELDGEPA